MTKIDGFSAVVTSTSMTKSEWGEELYLEECAGANTAFKLLSGVCLGTRKRQLFKNPTFT